MHQTGYIVNRVKLVFDKGNLQEFLTIWELTENVNAGMQTQHARTFDKIISPNY